MDDKTALIIGGTRGIGHALANILRDDEWSVTAYGRAEFDVLSLSAFHWARLAKDEKANDGYNVLVYCAGDITIGGSLAFHYPLSFYELVCRNPHAFRLNAVLMAVSSVAAYRPAKVNPHYAAAKAALESYVRTLADSEFAKAKQWHVCSIRFDLVDTEMLRWIEQNAIGTGRPFPDRDRIISPETAARRVAIKIYRYLLGDCQ